MESKRLILVVEDDPTNQKLINYYLKEKYDMVFAKSVINAQKILKEQAVDLVLLDLSLDGDEDGLALAQFIRNDEVLGKLPIIATTAHAFTKDRDKCLEAGCNDFLSKPLGQGDLLDKIDEYLK